MCGGRPAACHDHGSRRRKVSSDREGGNLSAVPTARARCGDPGEILRVLLAEEIRGRDEATRGIRRKAAGFPSGKTLDSWREDDSSIPRATQQPLTTLEWIHRHENLAVCGPSGTGELHWCEVLEHAAIEAGMRVSKAQGHNQEHRTEVRLGLALRFFFCQDLGQRGHEGLNLVPRCRGSEVPPTQLLQASDASHLLAEPALGQHGGGCPLQIIRRPLSLLIASPGNALSKGSVVVTMSWAAVVTVVCVSPWGMVTTYITERFPTSMRASGYGIGYSLAVVIPSFYATYMLGLGKLMPFGYTPIVLIVLGGMLTTLGAWLGPETRHVDLKSVETAPAREGATAAVVTAPR